jgi:hypothetical protein
MRRRPCSAGVEIFATIADALDDVTRVMGRADPNARQVIILLDIIDLALRGAGLTDDEPRLERTATALAAKRGLRQDTISKVLRALEHEYGYVFGLHDKRDRRVRHYYPTPAGRDFAVEWARRRGVDLTSAPMETVKPPLRPKVDRSAKR